MGKAFFITGTDTGVGKTFFAASLAACLREAGHSVGVFKPIESGCRVVQGRSVPEDAALLARASGCGLDLSVICLYCLREALAPSEAARMERVKIDPTRIVRTFYAIADSHDVTLVEGAGGLLAPLYERWTVLDLALELNVPVINVVGSRLGAINHALLTERAILDESLELVGHVLNNLLGSDEPAALVNPDLIRAMARRPVLGILPKAETPWLEPRLFKASFDLRALGLD